MIPKFRVWDKVAEDMFTPEVLELDKYGKVTGIFSKGTMFSIEDFELLQSTGLFDKNGKEIFEGDIVKHEPVPNPFISNAYFEIIQARSGEWRMDNYRGGQVLAFSNHEVEVVGNKFEHPHLLGEE
ncbi:YopX family protein [Mammaliicoccus sciuri]|uniref:YopX family protein n=1 Tax=Mammaliicoccus sciuri TaxID=1296 RepID=UPI001330DA8B|nr:YopX family protein [Mammaliicoccus sciuri]